MNASSPRNKPFFIEDACPTCGSRLELHDILEAKRVGAKRPKDKDIWYDEWSCVNGCEGICLDWAQEEIERLLADSEAAQQGGTTKLEDVLNDMSISKVIRGDC